MPTEFEISNGHIMYILLQNVTSATKVVRNLLNVEDILSLISSAKCSGKIQEYAEIY